MEDLKGTIRINNVLVTMHPYGCWSDKFKSRVVDKPVRHGNGHVKNEGWEHRMSRKCRYDNKHRDERCVGCAVEWDDEYVRNLR